MEQSDQTTVWGHYYQTIFKHCPLGDCNVLILGNGFVGSALYRAIPGSHVLTRNGMLFGTNRVVDKYFKGNDAYVKMLDDFTIDGITRHLWRQVLRKYDVVINTIANTNTMSRPYSNQVQEMVNTNYTLPVTLANICQDLNIIFVNISTACLLPDVRDGRLIGCTDTEQAEAPYYATKMLADGAIRDLDCVITVRPRLIYDDIGREGNQCTRTNLTYRVQDYPRVYDCPQSFTHRITLVAAIVHLVEQRLDTDVVQYNQTYNVTDVGLSSLQYLTANPDVEVIPCQQTIGSFSPARIIQADITPLISSGFTPINVERGIKQAQISAACLRNSNSSPKIVES